jgi:hypothetical protein
MFPHRSTSLFVFVIFFIIALLIFSSSPSPSSLYVNDGSEAPKAYIPKPKLPSFTNFRFPFRPSVHKPPEQPDSSGKGSKWYSDWKWLNPFSYSITLDEDRAVLPPLPDRPPIYTFYDSTDKKDKAVVEADHKLLLAWRRAWYAQGFRPVVLGRQETQENQLYQSLKVSNVDSGLLNEFYKWLAWGHMGDGILADPLCFPMGPYDDELLSQLRRGTLPTHITRFANLGAGLFSAEKSRINDAIKEGLRSANLESAKSIMDVIPPDLFKLQEPSSLAFYNPSTVTTHYPSLAEKVVASNAEGRLALVDLINSHLHTTFQNTFSAGIHVLKPLPESSTALVDPGVRLANLLTQCSSSIQSSSCPPNRPNCQPCSTDKPLEITQPSAFKNSSDVFTIGAIPHPFTRISLQHGSDDVTTRHIRRETERDPWVLEITKDILGKDRGGPSRVVSFKEIVAGDSAISRSLWFTVEDLPAESEHNLPPALLDNMEWQFGFLIPRKVQTQGKSGEGPNGLSTPSEDKQRTENILKKEYQVLGKARDVLKKPGTNRVGIKAVAEAWNLADTEVWRFVKAYQ